MEIKLVAGDKTSIPVNITFNGVAQVISPTAIVEAGFHNRATGILDLGPIPVTEVTGSDWANGKLIVVVTPVQARLLIGRLYRFEIQIKDPDPFTWYTDDAIVEQDVIQT